MGKTLLLEPAHWALGMTTHIQYMDLKIIDYPREKIFYSINSMHNVGAE